MKIHSGIAAFISIIFLTVVCNADSPFNEMRLAYWNGAIGYDGDYNSFLLKTIPDKYNYVLCEFQILPSGTPAQSLAILKSEVKKAFIKASGYNLGFIPGIQMSSQWSYHWVNMGNANIEMNWYKSSNGTIKGTPSFAPDPHGIDKSFIEVLKIIKQAIDEGKTENNITNSVNYLFIGHDEFMTEGMYFLPALQSAKDRIYIDKLTDAGKSPQVALQTIVAAEIYRRLQQAQTVFGTTMKTLLFADMFDPEANGGQPWKMKVKGYFKLNDARVYPPVYSTLPTLAVRYVDEEINISSGFLSLPGLSTAEKQAVKSKVIFMPWSYLTKWYGRSSGYNANNTFKYFSDNGCQFIYTSAYSPTDTPGVFNIYEGNIAMKRYQAASLNYRSNCRGYYSAHWCNWREDGFKMLDSLYISNIGFIPNPAGGIRQ
jgi:hypothetical protein